MNGLKSLALLVMSAVIFPGLMRTVLDRPAKEPATAHVTDQTTRQERTVVISRYVMQLLTASAVGTDAISAFPRLCLAASNGDSSKIARQWAGLSGSSIGSAMAFAIDCASGVSAGRRQQVEREKGRTLPEDAAAEVCAPEAGRARGVRRDVRWSRTPGREEFTDMQPTIDWKLSDDIEQDVWEKLVFLSALAAATCLFGANVREIVAARGDGARACGQHRDRGAQARDTRRART